MTFMRGWISAKKLLREVHVHCTPTHNRDVRAIMEANHIEMRQGKTGKRVWYKAGPARQLMAQVIEKIKAGAKRPGAIGVPVGMRHNSEVAPRRIRKARTHRVHTHKPNGTAAKGVLLSIQYADNATLLVTMKDGREIWERLNEVFG